MVEKENGEDALVILDPSMSMAKMRFLLDKLKKNIKNNPQNIVNKEKKNESYEKKVNKNLSGPEKSSNMKNQTKPKDSEKKSLKNDMMKEIKEFIYEGKELQRAQYQLIMVVGRFTDDEEWMVRFEILFLYFRNLNVFTYFTEQQSVIISSYLMI